MPAKTLRDPERRHLLVRKGAKKWIAGAAVAVALAVAITIARRTPPPPADTVAQAKSATFAAEAWPAGALATYRIAWKSDADATLDVGGVTGRSPSPPTSSSERSKLVTHVDVEGELTLRSYGPRDGAVMLGFVLSRVNVARAEALGRPPTNELEAELRAGEVVALIEPDGHVRELGFSATTTPTARGALRALVLEYTAEVSAANGRSIVDTSLGRARIEKNAATGKTKRVAYDELDALPDGFDQAAAKVSSTGDGVALTGDGPAATVVTSNEEISAKGENGLVSSFHATTSLSATLVRTAKEPPAPLPDYVPAPIRREAGDPNNNSPEEHAKQHRASLERRSLGVTAESVYADVQVAAALPQKAPTEWLWRDSAFLELHPEQTSLLLDRAMRDPFVNVRAAAIDIVVISGTDAAQRALSHAFDTTKTKMSNEDREILFQHLGQVLHPSADFLRWAETEHDKSKGTDMWLATSYTLGGLAWHAEDEHPEVSNRLVAKLEGELRVAQNDALREIGIRALGNAGAARSLPLLVPYAKSKSAAVRAAVASALRRTDGEASVDALLALVMDTDSFVATEAVTSLYRKELAFEDWQALGKAVDEDRLQEAVYAPLVDGALLRQADNNPESAALLTAMMTSPKTSYKLKERITMATLSATKAPPSP